MFQIKDSLWKSVGKEGFMRTIFMLMLFIGAGGIAVIKAGNSNAGLALIAFAYYLFTLWVVLGLRQFLHFLSSELKKSNE